ncbi:MAG TPA: hypothetical protein DCL06_11230, partial [Corynebacterium variabile]|nr:hypothetical protein [Corynebacterium variabile]
QSPLILREAPGDHEHGRKNVELARRAGKKPMPWQVSEINAINATGDDGRWVHSDAVLICPRQNGKSLVVALVVLYRIYILHQKVLFTAQQWTTAKELWDETWKIIRSRRFLSKELESKSCSQGRGTFKLKGGGEVVFTTRSPDAGRGLTKVDLMVFDEAYNLTDPEIAALAFLSQAAEDPQVFYMSSSVHREFRQHQNGQVLSAMRHQAIEAWDADEPLYLSEYAAPEDLDPELESTWQQANPSYGVISNAKKMRNIMRRMNTEAGRINFGVEALGWGLWFDEDARDDDFTPVLDDEQIAAMTVESAPLSKMTGLAVVVDASPDRSVCAVSIAGRHDGHVIGHLGYLGDLSTADVVAVVMEVCERVDPAQILIDSKSPAWTIGEALDREGIEVTKLTFPDIKHATAAFLQGRDDGTWFFTDPRHRIADAFAYAQTKETGGEVRWTSTGGAICQLTATNYAMWAAAGSEEIRPAARASTALARPVKNRGGVRSMNF